MRLFVAAHTPPELMDVVRASVSTLQTSLTSDSIRWMPESKWHMTLAFLGEQDEADLPQIVSDTDKALRGKGPFDLISEGVSQFTSTVLAYRFFSPDGLAGTLATDLGLMLDTYEPNRRFRPHITIARMPKDPLKLPPLDHVQSRFSFTEVMLYQSRLQQLGSEYSAIKTWSLGPE